MKKLFLIITLSISTFIVGCGCGNSEPTNTIVPETETQAIELETETELATEEIIETETVVETTEAELDTTLNESTGVEIVEVLDTKMWVIKHGNLRTGDGTNYNLVDVLVVNAELTITGKTSNGWYEVAWGAGKAYAPAGCLSTEKPAGLTSQEEGGSSLTDEEWAEYDAKFEELLNESTESEGNDGSGDLYFGDNPDSTEKDQSKIDFGKY